MNASYVRTSGSVPVVLMASSSTLKVHEVTQVTPSADSATELSLPLTLYDTFWFKFPPVERLFFYQFSHLTPPFFYSVILPKLKHSLSLTLRHYLPLAGNLIWPPDVQKPAIYYCSPNDGISVTVSESNTDFDILSGNGICQAVLLRPLVPELLIFDDTAAIISIQITLFPNKGFSIGITSHHAILDGRSSTNFVKSWAYLCKCLVNEEEKPSLLPELTPCIDRSVIKDPTGIDMVYVNNWLDFTSGLDSKPSSRSLKVLPIGEAKANHVRATFDLTREDIKKLRNKVLSILDEEKQSKQLHLSTFVLTIAYVFVCMVKAKESVDSTSVLFLFTADYRTRLNPPLPINYFGNCVMSHVMLAQAKDFKDKNGVAFVAQKLSDVIKRIEKGVLEGTEESLLKILRIIRSGKKTQILGVAGSIQFDVYGSDFGWGRPKKVKIVSIDQTGANSLAPSRDGSGGVEVGVVLDKQEMEIFASLFADGLKDLP